MSSIASPEPKPRTIARLARLVIQTDPMNKKEAADYLGISTRALEAHAKNGKVTVRYERGRTGDVAIYDDSDLRKLKAEIDSRRAPRPAVVSSVDEQASNESRALVRGSASGASSLAPTGLFEMLADLSFKREPTIADLSTKPLLTLAEAARLTGLARGYLRAAIEEKKLPGKIIGKSWRVKRADLDAYIRKL